MTRPVPAANQDKRTSHISVFILPDEGIRFVIDVRKDKNWLMFVVGPILGVVAIPWGISLLRSGASEQGGAMLLICGCLTFFMGLLMAVVHITGGPPRNIVLEAWPGKFKADRSIAGDHVVRTYNAEEILYFYVEMGILHLATRIGDAPLVGFGGEEVNTAIGTQLAVKLWQGEEVATGSMNVGNVKRWMVFSQPRMEARRESKTK